MTIRIILHSILISLLLMIMFSGCSEEFRPQKIRLAAGEAVADSLPDVMEEPEGPEIAVFEVLSEGNRPVFLFLPVESDIEGDYTQWLETSINQVSSYLFGQYSDLKVFPYEYIQQLAESENIDENASEEILSMLLNYEEIHYYIRSYLGETEGRAVFRYSLHDAKSHASLLEQGYEFEDIDGIVSAMNNMTQEIHNLLYAYDSSEFVPLNTSYKALYSFVTGEKAADVLDFDTALFYYIDCLREDPAFARAYLKTASLYFYHYSDLFMSSAEPFLQNAFRYYEQFSEHDRMLFSAYRKFYFRKYEESYQTFQAMINYFPESSYGYSGAVRLLLTMNNPEEAQKFVEEWNEKLELDITFLRLSSETYNMLGYFDRSLEKIREYQQLSDQSIVAMIDEARLLYNWGRTNEALNILDRALQNDPDNYSALALKGDLYFERMEFALAASSLTRAVRELPPERSAEEEKLTQKLFLANVYAGQYTAAQNIAMELISSGYSNSNYKSVVQYISEIALLEEDYAGKSSIIHAISSLIEIQTPDFIHQRLLLLAEAKSNNPGLKEINTKLLELMQAENEQKYLYLSDLKEAYKAWYGNDFATAIELLETSLEIEFNSVVAYYLCQAYIQVKENKKAEGIVSRFYNSINLYDYETAYILPRYYMVQAELLEINGRLAEAGQLYSNLAKMWNSADSLPLKTKILEKLMTINSN